MLPNSPLLLTAPAATAVDRRPCEGAAAERHGVRSQSEADEQGDSDLRSTWVVGVFDARGDGFLYVCWAGASGGSDG